MPGQQPQKRHALEELNGRPITKKQRNSKEQKLTAATGHLLSISAPSGVSPNTPNNTNDSGEESLHSLLHCDEQCPEVLSPECNDDRFPYKDKWPGDECSEDLFPEWQEHSNNLFPTKDNGEECAMTCSLKKSGLITSP